MKLSDLPAEVSAFLANYPENVRLIALRLRGLVRELFPEAVEQIDLPARMIAYGFKPTYKHMICTIMPYAGWVNLGLPRGAELDDPAGLISGTGKHARHVRLTSPERVDQPEVRTLLLASAEQIKSRF